MAYHDAFWAVVGGAAPVIALAAVVSLGDWTERRAMFSPILPQLDAELRALQAERRAFTNEHGLRDARTWDPEKEAEKERNKIEEDAQQEVARTRGQRSGSRIMMELHVANICVQAALLAVALLSLADAANLIPPTVAIVGTVLGLALLVSGSVLGARVKQKNVFIRRMHQIDQLFEQPIPDQRSDSGSEG